MQPYRGLFYFRSQCPTHLAEATAAIARLDEALASHPLQPAFLYRARLEAVRRQAAVDGRLIDPWHLAAVLEGLRLRMDGALRIVDRGAILVAAQHALALHQWLMAPEFDEEGEVQQAERHLAGFAAQGEAPLLAAAQGAHAWLDRHGEGGCGAPPPIRAALVRFWIVIISCGRRYGSPEPPRCALRRHGSAWRG